MQVQGTSLLLMFQSTHPRGVRLEFFLRKIVFFLFQSTHPRGVRLRITSDDLDSDLVSIHAPTWGATEIHDWFKAYWAFQSTHPRGVRRYQAEGVCRRFHVSIHAPTWGATSILRGDVLDGCVSIHAPTWGATHASSRDIVAPDVSIHAPTWGATSQLIDHYFHTVVSIHAPTWGATQTSRGRNIPNRGFNPRTHVGCDFSILCQGWRRAKFQSTHPRGVRLRVEPLHLPSDRFQSTHPRGVRPR